MAVPELGGTIAADVVSLANGLGALDPIAAARALTAMQQSGDGSGESGGLDIVGMVLSFLAGIVIFLYGVNRLADGLRQIGDDRIKEILARFTTNPLAGVLAGTAATTLLDSSSVTIIMTIALVSAGLLTFTHSLGVATERTCEAQPVDRRSSLAPAWGPEVMAGMRHLNTIFRASTPARPR